MKGHTFLVLIIWFFLSAKCRVLSCLLFETVTVKSELHSARQSESEAEQREAAEGQSRTRIEPLISTLHPWWHTNADMPACLHAPTHPHTHIHTHAHQTGNSTAVQTGLIKSHSPLPCTTTRVLTTQRVDAQPRFSIRQSETQQHQWTHIIIHLTDPRA